MIYLRWFFRELVRLVRACWTIYFEAHPFEFREGDISRSFQDIFSLASGVWQYSETTIETRGQLYIKEMGFGPRAGTALNDYFYVFIEVNGVVVHEFVGNVTGTLLSLNRVFGPGTIKFNVFTTAAVYAYLSVNCWERQQDDLENRLRSLSPDQD